MPLEAHAAALLDLIRNAARPPLDQLDLLEARRGTDETAAKLGFGLSFRVPIRDEQVHGLGGAFGVRVYQPGEAGTAFLRPCILFFHGGGWMVGSLAAYDAICHMLSRDLDCVVVSVDYRLAPEHPFPGAVEDAVAAARWLLLHGARLGVDPARVALCGDSAGGNLAAVTALHADDERMPAFCCQILLYPVTDLSQTRGSHQRYADYLLTNATMRTFIDRYMPDASRRGEWRGSPVLAPHLERSPPTIVYTAEFDILHDEGVAFVERLKGVGVEAVHREVAGQMHAFLSFGRIIPAAADVMKDIVADFRRFFG